MRGVKKSNLPKKICSACGLEFVWRKKWVKNWGEKGKITRPKKWDNRSKKGRGKANTSGTVFPEPGHQHNFSETHNFVQTFM